MPRSSRSPASRSPQRLCANATRKAPSVSAGSAARSHPGRCATVTDCWSAGASARRHFRRSCSRPRPRRCCVKTAAASWRSARTTWGRAPGPRWHQIAADGLGLDIDRVEFRSGTSDLPDAGIAGGSAHTATAGMAIHNAGADVVARLADLATNDDRSPLFGAGNAGVIARDGRLFRRDDESRSESLRRYPRPRRPRGDRGSRQ